MDFLRRLLGPRSEPMSEKTLPSRTESASAAQAPVISAPNTSPLPKSQGISIQMAPGTVPLAKADNKANSKTESKADSQVEIDPSPTPGSALGYGGSTRPLPPLETYASKPGKHITYGLNSDIGLQRSNNQDSLVTFFTSNVSVEERPDFGLFAVADGMGGHHDGEKASAITIRILTQYIVDKLYLNLLTPSSNNADRPTISETLSQAILRANDAVSEQIPEGGTTVTAVVVMGDLAYVGHVGDSRAYLITNENIEQITRDHSLVQRLIELDQLTPEEALSHPQRNVLYRAIGTSENLEVDAVTRRLPPAARLLICSDGLWNLVPEDLLLDIVRSSKTPQEACDRLIALANERGGPDNISAILIQTPG